MPTKEKKPILDRMADENQFTKAEAQELTGDLETQVETAEALAERLDNLTSIDLDELGSALEGLKDLDNFLGIDEHIDALKAAKGTAESVQQHLGTITDNVPEFVEAVGAWVEGEDAQDRASGKADAVTFAGNIRDAKNELAELGINIEEQL